MKIEIAKLGRMSQVGSSLKTLYQDKHTPILDLLVRESIQNCLDAGATISPNAENKKYVEVSFLTGDFRPSELNSILEGSTEPLNKRFPQSNGRFLAVKDKYAAGLTGPLKMSDVEDYKYGNLLKLVYDICKPQENAGSGGSWGIGKTIYFRVGIGLVLYYSRIWDDEESCFKSRFAASLVEDERSKDCVIPKSVGLSNSGIAWWGDQVGENETQPVTNDSTIEEYLKIFHITPFQDKETGTVVIVPYIDENYLLTNNRMEEDDPTKSVPVWLHSIDDYLSIAIQRWYFPRLNNSKYIYGKYLKLYINDKLLSKSDMLPHFRIWQHLYNCAAKGEIIPSEEDESLVVNIEKISLRKHLDDSIAGYVAYSVVHEKNLLMTSPDNLYSPYNYIDLEESESDINRPLISFCRMPGMVVNYKGNEVWLKGVPYTDKSNFILAIFVLNSNNSLQGKNMTLEEYVRKSELADHHAWDDYNIGEGRRPDIISKIKTNTANKLSRAFDPAEEAEEEKVNSGWGQVITDMLLPQTGFGTKSSRTISQLGGDITYESQKDLYIALNSEATLYYGDIMEFSYFVKSRRKTSSFNLNFYIDSESKSASLIEWENDGLSIPFYLFEVELCIQKLDGVNVHAIYKIDEQDTSLFDDLFSNLSFTKTDKGNTKGICVKFETTHDFEITVTFKIKIFSRNVRPFVKSE